MSPIKDSDSTQRVGFQLENDPQGSTEATEEEKQEAKEVVEPLISEKMDMTIASNGKKDGYDEERDTFPYIDERKNRFSVTSRPSFGALSSRPSFAGLGGLSSRPSMASMKSTISRVNSALYPERGSALALSLGASVAEVPQLAQKLYIITQVLAAVSVSIGSMAIGFSSSYTSPALADLGNGTKHFNVTDDEKSWIGSLMPLSALTGSIIGGYLIDALGRKMVILICGPPFILAWLLIGSAINIWMIYAGRMISGLCVGLLSLTLPVYLCETIQPEIRGILGLLPTTIGNGGILVSFLVGSFVSWWVLAYVGAVIPIIFTFMMCFVPETPRWYFSKGRVDDAQLSLEWLRGSDAELHAELQGIQQNYEMSCRESSSFRDIFKRSNLIPFSLSLGLMLFQQLSGINAVIFYTVEIFELSGSTLSEYVSTVIVGVVNLLSTLLANAVIDRLGRKILLYVSSGLMVFSLLSLGTFFTLKTHADSFAKVEEYDNWQNITNDLDGFPLSHADSYAKAVEEYDYWQNIINQLDWLPLLSFIVYVIAFSLGWGPIPWLFMGEALPARIRGPAASFITAVNWTCTFVITKSFKGLVKAVGPGPVFFGFSAIMILGTLYSIFFIPETKGKSLEMIEAEFSGRRKSTSRDRKISTVSGLQML